MATRRVRRDSETSTDSWSLVEEDHLSDDISVHSTEEESDDDQEEPIIEEPPTSDDETASEDSESEDSDSDCDSDSDSESDSEVEKDVSEASEVSDCGEDSDLEIQEEELEKEEDEEMSEEEKEAVRKCKEEDWYNEEEEQEEYDQEDEVNRIHPIPLAIALAFMFGFFVAADRYTSYLIKKEIDGPFGVFGDYSQQSYNSKRIGRFGVRQIDPEPEVRYDYRGRPLEPLSNKLKKLSIPYFVRTDIPAKYDFFAHKRVQEAKNNTDTLQFHFLNDTRKLPVKWINIWRLDREIPILLDEQTSLAPIPPAPFTPRRAQKQWIPKYQPCLVHVNESKWTCQKNVPAVYYSQSHLIKKWKKSGRTGGNGDKKKQICGKKASESMRTISKPTDQCESRHFSKYTPRRKHIAYKTPLPCKAPNYKPSHPKPTQKPSSSEDWFSKRSQVRAQLRSRA